MLETDLKCYQKTLKLLMPCPFTDPKMFCADPNILSQPKNLTAFSASSKPFVLTQKPSWMQIFFLSGTKWFWLPKYVNKIFGLAQKIWTSQKHFRTCKSLKRTRHYNELLAIIFIKIDIKNNDNKVIISYHAPTLLRMHLFHLIS